ncbi:MAG: hypothetical protein B7Z23_10160, partial [Pseudomonadales bacterium 32-61-5]
IGRHAHLALVHTSIEHRRVLCRGILISGYQEPYAQQASNRAEWCSRLLKMTEHLPGYDETPTNAAHCLPCHAFTASACACAAYPSSRLPKVSAATSSIRVCKAVSTLSACATSWACRRASIAASAACKSSRSCSSSTMFSRQVASLPASLHSSLRRCAASSERAKSRAHRRMRAASSGLPLAWSNKSISPTAARASSSSCLSSPLISRAPCAPQRRSAKQHSCATDNACRCA